MRTVLSRVICLAVCFALAGSAAMARGVDKRGQYKPMKMINMNTSLNVDNLHATAVQGTTVLGSWTFDSGGSLVEEGWTRVDLTAQMGDYFHVDDFAGLGGGDYGGLLALEGSKSMWCGARPDAGSPVLCGYQTLPGYGHNWSQAFSSICFTGVTGALDISYLASWDSETGWDWTSVEYSLCDDLWNELDRYGNVAYDTLMVATVHDTLHSGSVQVRFHFTSDGSYNDEDGFWNSDGAVIIDSLRVWDDTGTISFENFELEAVGAQTTVSGDWASAPPPGYGDFADLFSGVTMLDEDPCGDDLTGVWGFFNGSTANYGCGGYPATTTVPYENLRGQYIQNEVWSPLVPFVGTGTQVELHFDVYRDLPLDALIFYVWHVRSFVGGCPQGWIDDNKVYFADTKDWFPSNYNTIGQYIVPGASHLQFSIGAWDMCLYWCGIYGSGSCHSHAPLVDNIEVIRIATQGPQWEVAGYDLFQDSFSADGTTTGTVRIDSANDILPNANPNYVRGDSVVASVNDPEVGVAVDPYTGAGPAVYGYVSVRPNNVGAKSGDALVDDASRWPVVDSTIGSAGYKWYVVRMDTAYTQQGSPIPGRYCLDLNDNLFTPGDTIMYFLMGQSADVAGSRTYFHGGLNHIDNFDATGAILTTSDIGVAYANPMEVTCLPTVQNTGGDILFVDHGDGRRVQPFFETTFEQLGIMDKVDRYDVRGPSSGVNNGLGATVQDVFQQIIPIYRTIIWAAGDLDDGTIADGTGEPEKQDDFQVLYTFLDHHENNPGLYINGEGVAQEWSTLSGASALNLMNVYMNFNMVQADHREVLPLNPLAIAAAGGMFDHIVAPDTLVAFAGCPGIARLDVMNTGGGASTIEATYNGNPAYGAVLSQVTGNTASSTARVVLSGFPFDAVRDDRAGANGGVMDRVHHLYDILAFLNNSSAVPVDVKPSVFANSLSQNYPNPFNPQTTIDFTLKERSAVVLKVYNVAGQLVRTLVNDERAPGVAHSVVWDGRNQAGQQVASGVYFYKLVAKGFTQTKKMVLLK